MIERAAMAHGQDDAKRGKKRAYEPFKIAADGVATLYFADGGLFGNHSVVVYVGGDGELLDAKLAG
jgi:hypothetical protein